MSAELSPDEASVFRAVPFWMPSVLTAMLLRLRLAEVVLTPRQETSS